MKSNQLVMYPKGTEVDVHYPGFIWLCIASFGFGGVCWYLGYLGAVSSWLSNSSVVVSYLFYVLIVAIAFFYIRTVVILLDKKQNWLLVPGKRFAYQFFLCCLLPTLFLFWVIRPVAIPKDEWLWLPLLVLFKGILLLNIGYAFYFWIVMGHKKDHQIVGLERTILRQDYKIATLEERMVPSTPHIDEIIPDEIEEKEVDTSDELDLAALKAIDPQQEEFLLNNKFFTKKIMYSELGLFVFENTNNTPIVKLYLKSDMGESIACEQRSLTEVVRDTKGFVRKIGRNKAIALDVIQACYLLKDGRLRIVFKIPIEGKDYEEISPKLSKQIKDWVMLYVSIEKE